MVAKGNITNTPDSLTYSSVASSDYVLIYFVITALNGLEILAADIGNAYLNYPCRDKIYFTSGTGFGNQKGASVVLVRALYRLKYSGPDLREHCSNNMRDMDFLPSEADPDVCMQNATNPNGFEYW